MEEKSWCSLQNTAQTPKWSVTVAEFPTGNQAEAQGEQGTGMTSLGRGGIEDGVEVEAVIDMSAIRIKDERETTVESAAAHAVSAEAWVVAEAGAGARAGAVAMMISQSGQEADHLIKNHFMGKGVVVHQERQVCLQLAVHCQPRFAVSPQCPRMRLAVAGVHLWMIMIWVVAGAALSSLVHEARLTTQMSRTLVLEGGTWRSMLRATLETSGFEFARCNWLYVFLYLPDWFDGRQQSHPLISKYLMFCGWLVCLPEACFSLVQVMRILILWDYT